MPYIVSLGKLFVTKSSTGCIVVFLIVLLLTLFIDEKNKISV